MARAVHKVRGDAGGEMSALIHCYLYKLVAQLAIFNLQVQATSY